MPAKPKIAKILVVALIVSLVLVACGGGTSGKTWFNLPSLKVRVQENGTASVWGIGLPAQVLQPAMIQQLQTAGVQVLEVRIGYNGIHVYNNGADLPYVEWDQEKVETLQQILPRLNIPNGEMIADALPWLRTIGLGVALHLPTAGQAGVSVPRWSGETSVEPAGDVEPTIGPMTIGSLVFDPEGNIMIEGIPASVLQDSMGMALPSLDPGTLGMLQALSAESVRVETHSNGIRLFLNEQPLPGIAYDSQSLGQVSTLASAFVQDPATVDLVNTLVNVLPGTQLNVAISFTGEPAADTSMAPITAEIQPDGSMNVFGIPAVPAATVPADVVQNLQAAGVQQLRVQIAPDGLGIAANTQVLPRITWTDESLDTIAGLVGPLAGLDAGLLNSVLAMVRDMGLNLQVAIVPGEGAEVVEVPQDMDMSVAPPEAAEQAAQIRLVATYDGPTLQSVGGFTADDLAQLGVTLPDLPENIVSILNTLGAQQVVIDTEVGALHLLLDGAQALQIDYNLDALRAALELATPFLGESMISEPPVSTVLDESILPLVPVSDVDITLNLN